MVVDWKIQYSKDTKSPQSDIQVLLLLLGSRPVSSVQSLVVSDSLWSHGLQHARPLCPSPSPGVCSNSCPLSWWCHPTISSSDDLSSFCLQSFWASGSALHIRWPKYWSFSISTSTEYSRLISFRIDWFGLLAVRGISGVFSRTTVWKHQFFVILPSLQPISHNICNHCEDHSHDYMDHGRVTSLLFNTLSRFVIVFLKRSNCLLISLLQSPSTVILEPKKRKSVTTSTFSPSICHEVMGPDAMILVFLIFSSKPALSLSSFTCIKRLFSSSSLSAFRVVSFANLRLLMFLPSVLIPACNWAFHMMCSVYRLNKQGDNREPCHTPFLILNQSVFHTVF